MRLFKILISVLILCSIINSCKKTKSTGEWLAKIDDNIITTDEFDSMYYAQLGALYNETKEEIDKRADDASEVTRNPMLNKTEFLAQIINQRLVYNQAKKDGLLDDEEIKAFIKMSEESAVIQFYVKKKFENEIEITDKEIGKAYASQKDRFKGVPIEQAEQYIRQSLSQQKLQGKLKELIDSLRDGAKIEKRTDLISKPESSDEWLAKVDDDVIKVDEFNTMYYAQLGALYNETKEEIDKRAGDAGELARNPMLDKNEFLTQVINQRLVYNQAEKEGLLKDNEVQAFIDMSKESAVIQFYVKKKFENEIEITDEEIGKVYASQKDRFKGVPIEQAEQYIRQSLSQQKLQMKLKELIDSLRDGAKIEKRINLLSKEQPTVPEENKAEESAE